MEIKWSEEKWFLDLSKIKLKLKLNFILKCNWKVSQNIKLILTNANAVENENVTE